MQSLHPALYEIPVSCWCVATRNPVTKKNWSAHQSKRYTWCQPVRDAHLPVPSCTKIHPLRHVSSKQCVCVTHKWLQVRPASASDWLVLLVVCSIQMQREKNNVLSAYLSSYWWWWEEVKRESGFCAPTPDHPFLAIALFIIVMIWRCFADHFNVQFSFSGGFETHNK